MRAIRIQIGRGVSRFLTSDRRQVFARSLRATTRRIRGRPPTILYFHQFDDPYSALAATQLDRLRAQYAVQLECHAVPSPDAAAAPQADALRVWSARDASRLAEHFGLKVSEPSSSLATLSDTPASRELGRSIRERLGHYLGATFYFEGEWYWGIDRLHYLESRLIAAGLRRDRSTLEVPPLRPPALRWAPIDLSPSSSRRPVLEFFCSLRSPYTYLAVDRVRRLADHYRAALRIKFVLPMVMRGLPIPTAKRFYIVTDAKREATRLGLPFGDIADPVGIPAERGLAVLHRAIELGAGESFLESFLRGVFAEGIDAGTSRGLRRIASRAGLTSSNVAYALRDPSWRIVAEQHRNELLSSGLWGVPSLRVAGLPAHWGQDRLWVVEHDLINAHRTLSSESRSA